MKASELRIGNYIHINAPITSEGKLIRASVYHISKLQKNKNDFNPIPLTEEHFRRFGFEWNQKHCTWRKDNILLVQWNRPKFKLWDEQGFEIKIEYVHQLQNLYFTLTGEELIFEDKTK